MKPIVDAIRNKTKISFMYNGPRKPPKIAVKPGKRVNAEPVAIGLSKKGNLILRAWVGPPSVSKKGFTKTNWRTFMVGRMTNVQIGDETFDLKPGFKSGKDRSMSVTYVSADRTKKPQVKPKDKVTKPVIPTKTLPKPKQEKPISSKPEQPKSTVKPTPPKPTQKPEKPIPTTKQELPQPKPEQKPDKTPPTTKQQVTKQELPQPKPTKKPDKNPPSKDEDEMEPLIGLSESLKRIKTLMLY